jgi:hypothetical protein
MDCFDPLRMIMTTLKVFIVCGTAIFLCGCSPSMDDYKKTVRDGIKTVPHVEEIRQLFPNAPTDHFITQYGFDKNVPVTWNTVVYFYGRYQLDYQVDVIVDYKNNRISHVQGVPVFRLAEIVLNHPVSNRPVENTFASGHIIYEKDWKKIVAAKGDFSVVGISLITNSPVAGFDEYVRSWRKDRVEVKP